MSLLTDPSGECGPRFDRRERPEPVGPRGCGVAEPIDAEMLEVIQTFEALYAETPPPAGASPEQPADAGEDRIEFPDDFRVPAQRGSHEPAPDSRSAHDELGIDDAFALLRAGEVKRRTLADRHVIDRDRDDMASGPAVTSERSSTADSRLAASRFEPESGGDWSAKARAVWPKVLAAGAIALVVGVGLGYVAGYAPMPASTYAKIEVSPAGGAQLRFDYELDKK